MDRTSASHVTDVIFDSTQTGRYLFEAVWWWCGPRVANRTSQHRLNKSTFSSCWFRLHLRVQLILQGMVRDYGSCIVSLDLKGFCPLSSVSSLLTVLELRHSNYASLKGWKRLLDNWINLIYYLSILPFRTCGARLSPGFCVTTSRTHWHILSFKKSGNSFGRILVSRGVLTVYTWYSASPKKSFSALYEATRTV